MLNGFSVKCRSGMNILIHDFECRILSTMLLSNLSSPFYAKLLSIKLSDQETVSVVLMVHTAFSSESLFNFLFASWALQRCMQAGPSGQIKPGLQCQCLVLLFLFPSFSKAVHASETANACFLGNILPRQRHGFESKLPISLSSLLSKMGQRPFSC